MFECPDIFNLTTTTQNNNTKKWILSASNSSYYIGTFENSTFTNETELLQIEYGKNYYAAQTWNDAPQNANGTARIQLSWLRNAEYPGMPFNGQMSFPSKLTLQKNPEGDGYRMFRYPIDEIQNIWGSKWIIENLTLHPLDTNPLADIDKGELWDLNIEFNCSYTAITNATAFGIIMRGNKFRYSLKEKMLNYTVELHPHDGLIKMRALLDRSSLEVYANDGYAVFTNGYLPPEDDYSIEVFTENGNVLISKLELHQVYSIWHSHSSKSNKLPWWVWFLVAIGCVIVIGVIIIIIICIKKKRNVNLEEKTYSNLETTY